MSGQANGPRRPRDPNQIAAAIVAEATSEDGGAELETCPDCRGSGLVELENWRDGEMVGKVEIGCRGCKGTGQRSLKGREESPAATLGRKGGLKGGKARAESLTPERRKEIAINAAKARWRKAQD